MLKTVAVCDQRFDSPSMGDDGICCYPTYRELLQEELDILFVCLPNDLAPEVTIAGFEKGLHVFCEKPPGRDLADVARVIAAERAHTGLKLKYGFNHRYHDSIREALSLIQGGELGRVINLRGVYGKSKIISFDSDWRTKRAAAGGGILLDQGIHMVDMMRLFAGEFIEVHSFVSNSHWRHDVEDNAYALMRTAHGVIAMLHSSATQWRHRFHLEIALSRGAIVLSGILSGSKSYGDETITIARANADGSTHRSEVTIRYDHDPSWADEIAEFAACIQHDRPVASGSSQDALRSMQLVYKIYCADPEWREAYKLSDEIPAGIL
jgi:predicted dehydrogenase